MVGADRGVREYREFDDGRIKHLELLQAVIARLGNDGFLLKGWAVTLAAAFVGFAVERNSPLLATIGGVTTLALWALDGYFLRCERLFRELFRRVAEHDGNTQPFFMGATTAIFRKTAPRDVRDYWNAFFSASIGYFFGPIFGATFVAAFILTR